ncbi:hypothetical protein PINS_up010746 [Pythium insidiosum]|nr:hypothetical protein PINS_up010746 [Pythium insidiosum]
MPSPSLSPPTTTTSLRVVPVTWSQYRLLWVVMLCVRLACALFLTYTARLYVYLSSDELSYLSAMLLPRVTRQDDNKGYQRGTLLRFAASFAVLAAAHWYEIAVMLVYSVLCREFVFGEMRRSLQIEVTPSFRPDAPQLKRMLSRSLLSNPNSAAPSNTSSTKALLQRVLHVLRRLWRRVFGRYGLFGVESEFFEWRFLLRELAEIVSQSVQTWNASRLIQKPWINTLYVTLLALNCWSTLVIRLLCDWLSRARVGPTAGVAGGRSSSVAGSVASQIEMTVAASGELRPVAPAVVVKPNAALLERVLCISADLVLDAGNCMVLPLVLFLPYYRAFQVDAHAFPNELLYDDEWFVNLVREAQQVLCVSWADLVFTWVPHAGIYLSISSFVKLVAPPTRRKSFRQRRRTSLDKAHAMSPAVVPVPPTVKRGGSRKRLQRLQTLLHAVIAFWGIALVALHVHARSVQASYALDDERYVVSAAAVDAAPPSSSSVWQQACKLRVRPWLTRKAACSVVIVNCFRLPASTPPDVLLRGLDDETLALLIFSHCPALALTPTLQRFSNLLGLEFFNVTLTSWPETAKIDAAHHADMLYVIMAHSVVLSPGLPAGLVAGPLPHGLMDVEIVATNLTTLPPDLHERWHPMALLYLERVGLTAFPETLTALAVDDLSLAGNAIPSLERAVWHAGAAPTSLTLGYNPLTALPMEAPGATTTQRHRLSTLALEGTLLTRDAVPAWLTTSVDRVFAAHTPWCQAVVVDDAHAAAPLPSWLACDDSNAFAMGKFPDAFVASKRPL